MMKLIFCILLVLPSITSSQMWQGNWSSTFGKIQFIEKKIIAENASLIFGNYDKHGIITGIAIDNKLHGVFFDKKSRSGGQISFALNQKKKTFNGKWRFDNKEKYLDWNGTQLNKNFPVKLFSQDRYRKIEGSWNSNFGLLALTQEGVIVEGKYDDKGHIYAVYNQENRVLFGIFTNKDRFGLLKFHFDPDIKNFKGIWSWETNDWAKQKWDGDKQQKSQYKLLPEKVAR